MIIIQRYHNCWSTDVPVHVGSRCSIRLSPQTLCQTDTIQTPATPLQNHCAAWEEKTVFWQKITMLYIAVNKHASQSQVEDILRLTATSNAANTRVFNCVTVISYNIAVDVRLQWNYRSA